MADDDFDPGYGEETSDVAAPEAPAPAQPPDDWEDYKPPETVAQAAPAPAPAPAPVPAPALAPAQQQDDWEDYKPPEDWQDYTPPEGVWGTILREVAHGAGPAAAAALTGTAVGATTGAAIPLPGATLVGGLVGGFAGGMAAETVQDKAAKAVGFDDDAIRAANAQENPWSAAIGQGLSNLFGFSPRGIIRSGTRLLSGLISGGGEVGSQVYQQGSDILTPEGLKKALPPVAAQTAAGIVAPNPYSWGQRAEALGARVGERIRPRVFEPDTTIRPSATPPPEPTPPAQGQMPWGAERQPELPLGEPVPRPTAPTPQERMPFERVTPEGQYEFGREPGRVAPVEPFETTPELRQPPETPTRAVDQGQPFAGGEDTQGQLPLPPAEAPYQAKPHGAPGAQAAAGVSEAQAPPRGSFRPPQDYGKVIPEPGPRQGVNVGEMDPTLAHAVAPERPPAPPEASPVAPRTVPEAPPRTTTAAATPPETVRGQPETWPPRRPGQIGSAAAEDRPGLLRLTAIERAAQQAQQGELPPRAAAAVETSRAAGREPTRAAGDFKIVPGSSGQHVLMRGDQVVSQHSTLGQAMIAMNRAAREAGITPPAQGAIRRVPTEEGGRGRSGRPIRTEPLPIGKEPAILERGYEKATGPKLPPEQAPPERQAAKRQPSPAVQAVLDRIAKPASWRDWIPRNREQAAELGHRFYEGAVDALHPFARRKVQIEEMLGKPLTTEQDFHRLARAVKGLGGKMESILHDGPFDPETRKVIGPPLDPVLQKIRQDPIEFAAFATAKRAIEVESQGKKTGVPLKEANQVVAELGSKWGQTFKELGDFQNAVLKMGRHLIGDEGIAKMTALNKSYVPFYRAIDPKSELGDMFRTGGGLTVKDPIEKLKGSERQIVNPVESVLRNTMMIADLAEKNNVHLAMKKANDLLPPDKQFMKRSKSGAPLQIVGEQRQRMRDAGIPEADIDRMKFMDAKAFSPESGKMRLFENGKEHIYDVPKDIARVVAGADRPAMNMVLKILGTPARLLRAGATLTPEFGIKNIVRDQFTAFIQSQGVKGYIPLYDAVHGMRGLFDPKMAGEYNKWLRDGGANSNLVSYDNRLLRIEPRSLADRLQNVVTHPQDLIKILRDVSETMENATRFGGYLREGKAGVDAAKRAFNTRELTVDFQRMGADPTMRALNMLIPFFNANVQGLDRLGRAFKNDFPGTMIKTLGSITVPSVLLWMHNKDDPRYQELPQWQKMLFWIVPTNDWKTITPEMEKKLRPDNSDAWFRKGPDGRTQYNAGTLWRIPKPFAEGQIFGSLPERILESFVQQKPNAFKHVSDSIIDALSPSVIPQFARPMIEQMSNWNTFLQRPILPEAMTKKPQAQQQLPATSETAKFLASTIRAVAGERPIGQLGSPAIIDNYIRQLTGGLGQHVVSLIDAGLKAGKDLPPAPERSWADIPGIKAFAVRFPDRNAQSIQDFYDTRKERQEAKAGGDKKSDTGEDFSKNLKAQRDAITKITNDKTMSPADKRTAIDVTTLMMIETAKRGLAHFERTKPPEPGQTRQPRLLFAEGGEVEPDEPLDMDPLNPWQDPVQEFDPDLPLKPYEDPRGKEVLPDMDFKAPYKTPVYKAPGHRREQDQEEA
jgi:hypothetical protein